MSKVEISTLESLPVKIQKKYKLLLEQNGAFIQKIVHSEQLRFHGLIDSEQGNIVKIKKEVSQRDQFMSNVLRIEKSPDAASLRTLGPKLDQLMAKINDGLSKPMDASELIEEKDRAWRERSAGLQKKMEEENKTIEERANERIEELNRIHQEELEAIEEEFRKLTQEEDKSTNDDSEQANNNETLNNQSEDTKNDSEQETNA